MSGAAGGDDVEALAEVVVQITRVVGYAPIGTKDLLRVLRHPDVQAASIAYLAPDLADRLRAERAEGAREALEEAANELAWGTERFRYNKPATWLRARAAAHATQDPT